MPIPPYSFLHEIGIDPGIFGWDAVEKFNPASDHEAIGVAIFREPFGDLFILGITRSYGFAVHGGDLDELIYFEAVGDLQFVVLDPAHLDGGHFGLSELAEMSLAVLAIIFSFQEVEPAEEIALG